MPLLRLRSDEQLVALLRDGHDEAFRVIHDRYRKRLLAYTRQMLPLRQDAEDVLQDVFVRAYWALRANDRELALRAWLFRVAHNRCVDELRRPGPPSPEAMQLVRNAFHDPVAESDRRESLRRLIADVRRLPEQQRSALLMRELGGMSYAEVAGSLGISVAAVKSLLVRARIALAQAAEARDTACSDIREELIVAHDRGVRPNAMARRHMRDCSGCNGFRRDLRGVNRQLAALVPVGPLGALAKILGFTGGAGGGATASGAGAGGGAAAGAAGGGAAASAGALAVGAPHVASLIVAAVATASGAIAIQHTGPTQQQAHVRPALTAPAATGGAAVYTPAYAAAASRQATQSGTTGSTTRRGTHSGKTHKSALLGNASTITPPADAPPPTGGTSSSATSPTLAGTVSSALGTDGTSTDSGSSTSTGSSGSPSGSSTSTSDGTDSSSSSDGTQSPSSSSSDTSGSTTSSSSTSSSSDDSASTGTSSGSTSSGSGSSAPSGSSSSSSTDDSSDATK